MRKFISATAGPKRTVIYTDDLGTKIEYSAGDPCWRTNNPGNLRPAAVTRRNNQIGTAFRFAVFPDYQTGHAALIDCLKNVYGDKTIPFAIKKFAPESENNTGSYINYVLKKVGANKNQRINELDDKQFEKFWKAIEKMEGGKIGKIKKLPTRSKILKVQKNKKGIIVTYFIEGIGWISKSEAIKHAKTGRIDAVIATSRSGNLFLRTRPDVLIENNLTHLG